MYLSLPPGSTKAYLQWFPFTKLSDHDKKELCKEVFYNKYISSGSFVLFPEVMRHSDNYIQKGDGSFRNSVLISPLLFLIIQAIGKEISEQYISHRPNKIEAYYAGNYSYSRAKYNKDYDNFFKSINTWSETYPYFIKTDITNFFGNINVNKLIARIDVVCNKQEQTFSQTDLLLLKELLLYCGDGDYPLIENSIASSYMATIIYLDEVDCKLYRLIRDKAADIIDFRMIRYVDDLYILFSSSKDYDDLKRTYNIIKNSYSSILKEYGLSLNVRKCKFKKSTEINDDLKRSLYDEYVNGIEHNLEGHFAGSLEDFFNAIYSHICDHGITYEQYDELLEHYFSSPEIELTATSVYNYFVYENQGELKKPEVSGKLVKIIKEDISFLSIDPKRLSVMVMQCGNDDAVRGMLNQLFIRNRNGVWNSYDTTIAIAYLIQSSFQHLDLLKIIHEKNPDIYAYYKYCCRMSFLSQVRDRKWNRYALCVQNDPKAIFLYFMSLCESNRNNYLGTYAYYKNFFDRISADMDFLGKFDKGKRPNYNKYYKEETLKKMYDGIPDFESIIHNAHNLRNKNPLSHASAELIDRNTSSSDLKKAEYDLDFLINQYIKNNLVFLQPDDLV